MRLIDLFKEKEILDFRGDTSKEILSLSQKADKKCERGLFFCIKGISGDGHDFVNLAKSNGCVALVVERFVDSELPQILVKKVRNIVPVLCNRFYNNITKKLTFIGITGTNGKTTTSEIVYNMLLFDGKKAGLIGTNGIKFNGNTFKTHMTTPDTVDLFYYLNLMMINGIKYVVMEVSAHAISLKKLEGIKFEIGAITNISEDHLDYFHTMKDYSLTKLKFLKKKYCKVSLINVDDEVTKLFTKVKGINYVTYGIDNPAKVFACDVVQETNGTKFLMNIFDNVFDVNLKLIGRFNVYNALLASSIAKMLGVSNYAIAKTLNNLNKVDGRMNVYYLKNGATAVIDYAHTPDGLEKVLKELKSLCEGKLIVVFGCGGNRDKIKRPIMGKIASQYADEIIITNDNSRDEDKLCIAKDIIKGLEGNFRLELDRAKAINLAFNISQDKDIILLAGKGAEDYMEIKGKRIPFSDKNEILKYIK